MGRDRDRRQHVAARPAIAARPALSAQADLLAVLDAGGNAHIDLAPVGQGQPPGRAARGLVEGHRHGEGEILALHRLVAAAAATQPAEQVGEDVLGAEAFGLFAAGAARTARPPHSK